MIDLGARASGRRGSWTGRAAAGPGEREGGRMPIPGLKMIEAYRWRMAGALRDSYRTPIKEDRGGRAGGGWRQRKETRRGSPEIGPCGGESGQKGGLGAGGGQLFAPRRFGFVEVTDDPRGEHDSGGTVAVVVAAIAALLNEVGKVSFVSSGGDDLLEESQGALVFHSSGDAW